MRGNLAAFDALPMQEALAAAEGFWTGVWGRGGGVGREHFGSGAVFVRYLAAQARKDWREVDRLFLDEIRRDRAKYPRILEAEEELYAFNPWLCGRALGADHLYRWIDPAEIWSLLEGSFESKVERDGTRRGFKALSANPGLRFGERKIRMKVPVDGSLRGRIRCVRYTVLPRYIEAADERIGDPKSAEHADEAEVRVQDGTPIPQGAAFTVLPGSGIGAGEARALGRKYGLILPGG